MSDGYPADRLQITAEAPRQVAALVRFSDTGLDPEITELIEVRASQINGCAFCLDMHWKDARERGAEEARLYLLDAWRESPRYDERERAALALCEAMTVLQPGGVPDAVWDEAAACFAQEELARLVCAIAGINTWNRLQIATGAEPGHYQPEHREAMQAAAGETMGGAAR